MRILACLLAAFVLESAMTPAWAQAELTPVSRARVLSAKTVYFDEHIGVTPVRDKALAQLRKWGRYRIVQKREDADLIFYFSADPYKGGQIVRSGGQTGTIDRRGNIDEDPIPKYNKSAPVRYAYLTVIDARTGQELWSDSRVWGGLLTGFNSVGERLIKKLRKQVEK